MSETWSREYVVPLVLAAAVFGFALGRFTAPISTGQHLKALATRSPATSKPEEPAQQEAQSEDEDESDVEDGELSNFSGLQEECKMVLVVRTDLGMTKGTIFDRSAKDWTCS